MLNRTTQKEIEDILQPIFEDYFTTDEATNLLSKKESGHVMGTIIEENAGEYLKENDYKIAKEVNKLGEEKKRAHSDFEIIENGRHYRVNVKFSSETNGQPNICSMNRLLDGFRSGLIDSYYLLKVKHDRNTNETRVYFIDIVDYLDKDCIHFDGGTGQTMLKESKFYKTYGNAGIESNLSTVEKIKLLYELYIRQMENHLSLKNRQLEKRKMEIEVL